MGRELSLVRDDGEPYQSVNRAVLVLSVTQKFADWVNGADPSDPSVFTVDEINNDNVAYLIPEIADDGSRWIKQNYLELFELSLYGWYMDESTWPTDRSFAAFNEYFTYSIHSMVIDLADGKIRHEEM